MSEQQRWLLIRASNGIKPSGRGSALTVTEEVEVVTHHEHQRPTPQQPGYKPCYGRGWGHGSCAVQQLEHQ